MGTGIRFEDEGWLTVFGEKNLSKADKMSNFQSFSDKRQKQAVIWEKDNLYSALQLRQKHHIWVRRNQSAQYVVVVQGYFDNFANFFRHIHKISEIVAKPPKNRFGIVKVP